MANESRYILRDKAETFVADLYVCLRRYPKSERHVLAAETRAAAYRLLRHIIVVSKSRLKARPLEMADTEVALINALLRIGMQLEYLAFHAYERLAKSLDEIGRMIGAWMKNA